MLGQFNQPLMFCDDNAYDQALLMLDQYFKKLRLRGRIISYSEALIEMEKSGSIEKSPGSHWKFMTKREVYNCSEFHHIYEHYLDYNEVFCRIWKEELRKVNKDNRNVYNAGALHTLIGYQLWSDLLKKLLGVCDFQENQVGLTYEYGGAHRFRHTFDDCDDIYESDFANMDIRLQSRIIKDVLYLVSKCLIINSADDQLMLDWWVDNLVNPFLKLYDGRVYQLMNSNMSGHLLTVMVNSWSNMLHRFYVWIRLGNSPDLTLFRRVVNLKVYGDDTLMGVRYLGLNVPIDPDGTFARELCMVLKEERNDNPTFLKRYFINIPNFGYCPVHVDAMKAVASVVFKSSNKPILVLQQIDSLLYMHWFHEDVRRFLFSVADKISTTHGSNAELMRVYYNLPTFCDVIVRFFGSFESRCLSQLSDGAGVAL